MDFNFNNFWQKVLVWLHVKVLADGLEITDQAIRWYRITGGEPNIAAVKMAPGILQDGKLIDRPGFLAALHELRRMAFGEHEKGMRGDAIVVALGSVPTFMRLFELPLATPEKLSQAVALNLKMLSPSENSEIAAGWRVVHEDPDRGMVQVAGLFVGGTLVDDIVDALQEVGFTVVAVESKAVSLARVFSIRESGLDPAGAYIGVSLDDVGMDFAVVRNGVLCFSYALPWSGMVDGQGNISQDVWNEALARGIRQILNFYRQHWTDAPAAIVALAGEFFPNVEAIVQANFSIPVVALPLTSAVPVDMPFVFGAALRGLTFGADDHDITLLGGDAPEVYRKQKILFFLRFWRFALPVACGVILLILAGGDFFWLARNQAQVAASVPPVASPASAQLSLLAASATNFNRSVNFVASIEAAARPKGAIISNIETIAASSSVSLSRITIDADAASVMLSGTAALQTNILSFKDAVVQAKLGTSVTLPLSAIQAVSGGYSFTMTVNR